MTDSGNNPSNTTSSTDDFTLDQYRELLQIAKKNYPFAKYHQIPFGRLFVLWRHDCDFSINRSLRVAAIENDEGVSATYFINPHCEFYNVFEKKQSHLIEKIVSLGHDLGLHFDSEYHDISSEAHLEDKVAEEASLLYQFFGFTPKAFSFHNPTKFLLSCEKNTYGDLINCYSKRFKTEVPYCSDSNGYWRFRRLREILETAEEPCLQVLTHPGWWQKTAMPPRQRVCYSVYGRAAATMQAYDTGLEAFDRSNLAGPSQALRLIKELRPECFELWDYLWNQGHFPALFTELLRLHERQLTQLCKAVLLKEWKVPAKEFIAFFDDNESNFDGRDLFGSVFDCKWSEVGGVEDDRYNEWIKARNRLMNGDASILPQTLEEGCTYLCEVIQRLAEWGRKQAVDYDGIAHLSSIGIATRQTADGRSTTRVEQKAEEIHEFPRKKWEKLKKNLFEQSTTDG